jgi:hypothetical protein
MLPRIQNYAQMRPDSEYENATELRVCLRSLSPYRFRENPFECRADLPSTKEK